MNGRAAKWLESLTTERNIDGSIRTDRSFSSHIFSLAANAPVELFISTAGRERNFVSKMIVKMRRITC